MQIGHVTKDSIATQDMRTLELLNHEYVRSGEIADVQWYEAHLAEDFMNSHPDGSLMDRAAFLELIARGLGVSNIKADDVRIRLLGDLAIIHARTTFTTREGRSGTGRYTDVWSRRNGGWVCVAAHVTRRSE
jgi:ketosteroid isomerase-like protein